MNAPTKPTLKVTTPKPATTAKPEAQQVDLVINDKTIGTAEIQFDPDGVAILENLNAEAPETAIVAEHGWTGTDEPPVAMIRAKIQSEVLREQAAQDEKWGEQNHPNGTGSFADSWQAKVSTSKTDNAARSGSLTWKDILIEEVHEAFAESDPAKLRAELVQSAAVIAQWIAKIDRDAKKLADLVEPQGIAE